MAFLLHLPRASWLKKASTFLALSLIALGVALLAGRLLDLDAITGLHGQLEPMKANASIGLILFGVVLLLMEMGFRPIAWVALLPGLLGVLTLLEHITGIGLGIDELISHDKGIANGVAPGRMSPMLAGTFIVA